MNIRGLIGEDQILAWYNGRFIAATLRKSWLPDGVYDVFHHDGKPTAREVWIDGNLMWTISSMWIASGGPKNLPEEIISPPFGYFPNPVDFKPV